MRRQNRFATYAWAVLVYNILVILWGAFVRATGSGAGCGSHWPTCNGQIIPRPEHVEMLIEFIHRLTSGLAGVVVLLLFVWAFRAYPKRHLVRKAAAFSLLFVILEGLVGAGLVLFEWVAYNDSIARVISMAVHLNNTFLLLAALTLTAWAATAIPRERLTRLLPARLDRQGWLLIGGLLAMMIMSTAGAVTALGDTLFPAGSLAEGIARDFSPTAHFLERMRIWHPVLAVLTGAYLFVVATLIRNQPYSATIHRFAWTLQRLFGLQLLAGLVNVLLLAPVWMQILHLLLADIVWITLVLLAATVLIEGEAVTEPEAAPSLYPHRPPALSQE